MDIELIVLTLGSIAADDYLGKRITKYLPVITENIGILNNQIRQLDIDDEYCIELIKIVYQYYLLKDVALKP